MATWSAVNLPTEFGTWVVGNTSLAARLEGRPTECKLRRRDIRWDSFQPTNSQNKAGGQNDSVNTSAIDAIVGAVKAAGNRMIASFSFPPGWTNITTSNWGRTGAMLDYANAYYLAIKYTEANYPGIVVAWTVSNENDIGTGGLPSGATNYAKHATLQGIVYDLCRTGKLSGRTDRTAISTGTAIWPGGTSGINQHVQFYSAFITGCPQKFDAVNMHFYNFSCGIGAKNDQYDPAPQAKTIRSKLDATTNALPMTSVQIVCDEVGHPWRLDGTATNTNDAIHCNNLGSGSAPLNDEVDVTTATALMKQDGNWWKDNTAALNLGPCMLTQQETLNNNGSSGDEQNHMGLYLFDSAKYTSGPVLDKNGNSTLLDMFKSFLSGTTTGSAPTVTAVSPTTGPTSGGTSVTITGTGFTASSATVSAVGFGNQPATSYNVDSDTQITAVSPAKAAGTIHVTVTTQYGTSTKTTADKFTFSAVVNAPTVTAVSPTSGTAAGSTGVTITGTNFITGATVKFGATAGTSVVVVSSTSITCVSPAHAAGTVDVTVTTSGGTSATSTADQFTFTAVSTGPTITSIAPNHGPAAGATSVVITGTGFTGTSGPAGVKFGASNATSYNVDSNTQITAVSPVGIAGAAVDIVVTNAGNGSGTSTADVFTYDALKPPTVTALSPTSGARAGGTNVTITGTHCNTVTGVLFDTTPATNVVAVNNTTVTCTSPAGSDTLADVQLVNPDGTSPIVAADQFSYVSNPPTITLSAVKLADGTTITDFTNPITLTAPCTIGWVDQDDVDPVGSYASWLQKPGTVDQSTALVTGIPSFGALFLASFSPVGFANGFLSVIAASKDLEGNPAKSASTITFNIQNATTGGVYHDIYHDPYSDGSTPPPPPPTVPVVTIVSASPSVVHANDRGSTITWSADQSGTYTVTVAGATIDSGTYTTGTTVATLAKLAELAEGTNSIIVSVTDSAGTGSASATVTKSTGSPTVTIDSITGTITNQNSTVALTWHADMAGLYKIGLGGTDCSSGLRLESGSYTSGSTSTTFPASSFAEGTNVVRVCVGNVNGIGFATATVTKTTGAALTGYEWLGSTPVDDTAREDMAMSAPKLPNRLNVHFTQTLRSPNVYILVGDMVTEEALSTDPIRLFLPGGTSGQLLSIADGEILIAAGYAANLLAIYDGFIPPLQGEEGFGMGGFGEGPFGL